MSSAPFPYSVADTREIISPALLVFRELLEANLAEMIRVAGGAHRLRPHAKTHKLPQVARRELELGILKHKCATLAEAEMLAAAGARDIFLAYNLVGPNIARAVRLVEKFPDLRLLVTADHEKPLGELGAALAAAGRRVGVLLDLDTGMGRTGLPPGPRARALYRQVANTPGVEPAGLHLYDGQNHQTPLDERRAAVTACWEAGVRLRDELLAEGLPVPRIVAGGTGSFPVFAGFDDPTLELSPGTVVLHDAGYSQMYPDLHFTPAAVLLTRVISKPGPRRVTLDLGYKACASDPPAGRRLSFPDVPDAREVLQNEEHLVIETERADALQPGDELFAIPRHICPTTAMHKQVWVIADGRLADRWDVVGRDRWLSV